MRTEGSPHAEAAWRGIAQQNVQLRARIAELETNSWNAQNRLNARVAQLEGALRVTDEMVKAGAEAMHPESFGDFRSAGCRCEEMARLCLTAALTTPETDTLAEVLGASSVRKYGSHAEAVRAEMKRRTTPETDTP